MIITYQQSGGFVDIRKKCVLDTNKLADKAVLEHLVAIANLHEERKLASPGNDLITYTISVEKDGKTITFTADDVSMPAAVRPLVTYLSSQAKVE